MVNPSQTRASAGRKQRSSFSKWQTCSDKNKTKCKNGRRKAPIFELLRESDLENKFRFIVKIKNVFADYDFSYIAYLCRIGVCKTPI